MTTPERAYADYLAAEGLSPDGVALVAILRDAIATADLDMADLIARTGPKVTDGHSDGRRVRYVRAETRRETLEAILNMLEGES